MRPIIMAVLLTLAASNANAHPLDETMQAFCAQSAISEAPCKCAGDVMRRVLPPNEIDIVVRFARNQLSPDEIAKLPDGGAVLRGKFVDGWRQAQAECAIKQ
jgi:hypothetical protein